MTAVEKQGPGMLHAVSMTVWGSSDKLVLVSVPGSLDAGRVRCDIVVGVRAVLTWPRRTHRDFLLSQLVASQNIMSPSSLR